MIFLETSRKPGTFGYAKWPVAYSNIDVVWKKRSLEDVKINEQNQQNQQNIIPHQRQQELENRIIIVERNVEHLSQELKKLIKTIAVLVEKTNNRNSQAMVARMSPINNGTR